MSRLFSVLLGYNYRRKRPSHSQIIFRSIMSFPRDTFRACKTKVDKNAPATVETISTAAGVITRRGKRVSRGIPNVPF